MSAFDRSIREVRRHFERAGLGSVIAGVRGIRVVQEESFHDVRTFRIGLNPLDARKPFAAFHRRPYLLVHELGHQFVEACLSRADRRRLALLFGDYDGRYRRLPKPRRADDDHVSRHAMTHPAEDIAETFAVCLWRGWEPRAVRALLAGKSPLCRRKIAAIRRLIDREAGRRRAAQSDGVPRRAESPKAGFLSRLRVI